MEKCYSDCKTPDLDKDEIFETVVKMVFEAGLVEQDILDLLKEYITKYGTE